MLSRLEGCSENPARSHAFGGFQHQAAVNVASAMMLDLDKDESVSKLMLRRPIRSVSMPQSMFKTRPQGIEAKSRIPRPISDRNRPRGLLPPLTLKKSPSEGVIWN